MTNGRTYDTINTTKEREEKQMRSKREEIMTDIIRVQGNIIFWLRWDNPEECNKWEEALKDLQLELDSLS